MKSALKPESARIKGRLVPDQHRLKWYGPTENDIDPGRRNRKGAL